MKMAKNVAPEPPGGSEAGDGFDAGSPGAALKIESTRRRS
jgi:hypothetical protein